MNGYHQNSNHKTAAAEKYRAQGLENNHPQDLRVATIAALSQQIKGTVKENIHWQHL